MQSSGLSIQGPLTQKTWVKRNCRRLSVQVQAAAWTKAVNKTELNQSGGKKVIELNGSKILVAEVDGEIFAVSNKCSHLGLPLQGKTAMFTADIKDKCVTCSAHGTQFDLSTGEVKGTWCPKLPDLPMVGRKPYGDKKPLPTYQSRVDEAGNIEILA